MFLEYTKVIDIIARLLISFLFIHSGINALRNMNGYTMLMKSRAIPLVPILAPLSILLKIGGGLAILFGIYVSFFAAALALFTLIATLIFHDFWNHSDSFERLSETFWFTTNTAVIGGLLLLTTRGIQ